MSPTQYIDTSPASIVLRASDTLDTLSYRDDSPLLYTGGNAL